MPNRHPDAEGFTDSSLLIFFYNSAAMTNGKPNWLQNVRKRDLARRAILDTRTPDSGERRNGMQFGYAWGSNSRLWIGGIALQVKAGRTEREGRDSRAGTPDYTA